MASGTHNLHWLHRRPRPRRLRPTQARARPRFTVAASFALLLVLSACGGYGETRVEPRQVSALGATELRADFDLKTGRLRVSGGANEAMEADLVFNRKLEPWLWYELRNAVGLLQLRQPDTDLNFNFSRMNNIWHVRLAEHLPVEIYARVGSGEARLDLDRLTTRRVAVDSAIGNTTVLLGGAQPLLDEVRLSTGGGHTDLRLNGTYDSLRLVRIDSAAGDVALNLAGVWTRDMRAFITASTGTMRVQVPDGVGVIVTASTGSGPIRATGDYRADGAAYMSPNLGRSRVTLRVDVRLTEGTVELSFPANETPSRPH